MSAEGVVMGWARETPDDIEVVARLIDTETSEVLLTRDAYSEDKSPDGLHAMMEGLAYRFRRGLPLVEGTILRCDRGAFYVDAGSDAGLQPGQRLILFRPGPAIRHPVTGLYQGRGMERIAEGRIEEVDAVVSRARRCGARTDGPVRPADLFLTR